MVRANKIDIYWILLYFIILYCINIMIYADDLKLSFKIKSINVVGLERIELGSVFNVVNIKSGDTITSNKADSIVNSLYNTGFFQDIRLESHNDILIIHVVEKPIIAKMIITGDHVFDHDKLIKALQENSLASGRIFEQNILEQAILSLKSEYYNRGLYSVKISSQVIELERNRVVVNIAIDEGEVAKITHVQLIGNHTYTNEQLQKLMFLNTGNWLSWWYKDNQYSSDKLTADIENIKAFYLMNGFINFQILSVQVQLSGNKDEVYLIIHISEGKQYRVNKVNILGDFKDIAPISLNQLITFKANDIINQNDINQNLKLIKDKIGEYGYAFANINIIPNINNNDNTVDYTFFLNLGNKVYVRNINITGNDKTKDVVIRRELRQIENSLYDSSKITRSQTRLNLLDKFFKHGSVNITSIPVFDTNNQVDLNVKVEEGDTGAVNFSLGYVQGSGVLVGAGIKQSNLFGSGKSAALNATVSELNQNVGLSFTDPYFETNGTNLGYDIYYNGYTPDKTDISPYSTQTIGTKIRTSVPVSEFDRINFSLGIENVEIDLIGNDVPLRFVQFTNEYGNNVNDVPISAAWVRNTTDSASWPTSGAIFSEMFDATLPVLGPRYYRFTSQNTWFLPITNNFTWKINTQLGFIHPYGDSNIVPFYQNYYMGGINSVRGFYLNSMGPSDTDSAALGGTKNLLLTNDILFPLPGMKDDHTVRASVFFDMGTLWGGDNFALTAEQEFRASYGVGLTWLSPFGAIKFSLAKSLFAQDHDHTEPFQFMFGAAF